MRLLSLGSELNRAAPFLSRRLPWLSGALMTVYVVLASSLCLSPVSPQTAFHAVVAS